MGGTSSGLLGLVLGLVLLLLLLLRLLVLLLLLLLRWGLLARAGRGCGVRVAGEVVGPPCTCPVAPCLFPGWLWLGWRGAAGSSGTSWGA